MTKVEDHIPEKKVFPKGDVNSYVSCWTERDVLDGEVVDAMVVILRTSGCSWARKRGCTMCGYFNDCHPDADGENVLTQFQRAIEKVDGQSILKIFTSGSFFDGREIPEDIRIRILDMASEKFRQVIVESRPEFVTKVSLKDSISETPGLQIALGLESANNLVLEHSINKGFTYEDYLRAAETIKEAGASLKTYLLVKPPFLTEGEAIEDAVSSAEKIKDITDVISLNPVNVQRGTLVERLWRRGEYRPPWLWSVVRIMEQCADLGPRVISFPTGGGKSRGAHNCHECDRDVMDQITKYSLGEIGSFGKLDCECKERWMDTVDLQDFTQSSIDIQRYYG